MSNTFQAVLSDNSTLKLQKTAIITEPQSSQYSLVRYFKDKDTELTKFSCNEEAQETFDDLVSKFCSNNDLTVAA